MYYTDDKEVMTKFLLSNKISLMHASERLKNDEQFIRNLIDKLYIEDYIYIPNLIKENDEFIKFVLSTGNKYFRYLPFRIRDNLEIVKAAMIISGDYFKYVSDRLRGNFDVFMIAFQHCKSTISNNIIMYATTEITDNRDYVLQIAQLNNKYIIKYLPEIYRSDRKIMAIAIRLFAENIKYCSFDILDDIEYVIELIKINSKCYIYLREMPFLMPFYLYTNPQIIKCALKQDGNLFSVIPENCKIDIDYVLIAVNQNGIALELVPDIFKRDLSVAIIAVKKCGAAYSYVDESLKSNKEILTNSIAHSTKILRLVNSTNREDFKNFIQNQIISHYSLITFLIGASQTYTKCILSKLNYHGIYHSQHFKKIIGNYSNCPIGKQWIQILKIAKSYKII